MFVESLRIHRVAVMLAAFAALAPAAMAADETQDRPTQTERAAEPPQPRSTPSRPPTLVRAGDRVRAVARVGGVEAVVIAIAEQSGSAQQVIRVVNPDSRRAIRARVVAPGEVEVVNGR